MVTPGGCNVNFETKTCFVSDTSASLLVDQTRGWGPEVVTIVGPQSTELQENDFVFYANVFTP